MLPLPLNPDQSFTLQHVFCRTSSPHAVKVTVNDRFGKSEPNLRDGSDQCRERPFQAEPTWRSGPSTTFERQCHLTDPGADTWNAQVSFVIGSVPVTVST